MKSYLYYIYYGIQGEELKTKNKHKNRIYFWNIFYEDESIIYNEFVFILWREMKRKSICFHFKFK